MKTAGDLLSLFENRFEFLAKKLQDEELLLRLMMADPTADGPKKKAGKYTEWIIREYSKMDDAAKTRFIRDGDWKQIEQSLQIFHVAKNRKKLPPEATDINRMDIGGLYDVVQSLEGTDAGQTKTQRLDANTDVLVDNDGWLIVVPKSWEALKAVGGNTRWCNVAGEDMFDHYFEEGPSLVLIRKGDTTSKGKIQLHWPSNQFMDANDAPVNLQDTLRRVTGINDVQLVNEFLNTYYPDHPGRRGWLEYFMPPGSKVKGLVGEEGSMLDLIEILAANPGKYSEDDIAHIKGVQWQKHIDGTFRIWMSKNDAETIARRWANSSDTEAKSDGVDALSRAMSWRYFNDDNDWEDWDLETLSYIDDLAPAEQKKIVEHIWDSVGAKSGYAEVHDLRLGTSDEDAVTMAQLLSSGSVYNGIYDLLSPSYVPDEVNQWLTSTYGEDAGMLDADTLIRELCRPFIQASHRAKSVNAEMKAIEICLETSGLTWTLEKGLWISSWVLEPLSMPEIFTQGAVRIESGASIAEEMMERWQDKDGLVDWVDDALWSSDMGPTDAQIRSSVRDAF